MVNIKNNMATTRILSVLATVFLCLSSLLFFMSITSKGVELELNKSLYFFTPFSKLVECLLPISLIIISFFKNNGYKTKAISSVLFSIISVLNIYVLMVKITNQYFYMSLHITMTNELFFDVVLAIFSFLTVVFILLGKHNNIFVFLTTYIGIVRALFRLIYNNMYFSNDINILIAFIADFLGCICFFVALKLYFSNNNSAFFHPEVIVKIFAIISTVLAVSNFFCMDRYNIGGTLEKIADYLFIFPFVLIVLYIFKFYYSLKSKYILTSLIGLLTFIYICYSCAYTSYFIKFYPASGVSLRREFHINTFSYIVIAVSYILLLIFLLKKPINKYLNKILSLIILTFSFSGFLDNLRTVIIRLSNESVRDIEQLYFEMTRQISMVLLIITLMLLMTNYCDNMCERKLSPELELKSLNEKLKHNLISNEEYNNKRAEIISKL